MFQSQVDFHGYAPEDAIVEIKRRDGEHNIALRMLLLKLKN
jgi:kynureninase